MSDTTSHHTRQWTREYAAALADHSGRGRRGRCGGVGTLLVPLRALFRRHGRRLCRAAMWFRSPAANRRRFWRCMPTIRRACTAASFWSSSIPPRPMWRMASGAGRSGAHHSFGADRFLQGRSVRFADIAGARDTGAGTRRLSPPAAGRGRWFGLARGTGARARCRDGGGGRCSVAQSAQAQAEASVGGHDCRQQSRRAGGHRAAA